MSLLKKITTAVSAVVICTTAIFALSACGECDHTYNSWTVTKAATCIEAGEQVRSCMYCGEQETATVPTVDHIYGEYVKDNNASCVSMGTQTATCKTEGCTAKKSQILNGNPAGHNYTDGICSVCNHEMTLLGTFDASDDGSVKAKVYKGEDGYYALDITGSGAIKDYSAGSPAPWEEYADSIIALHIYEGITSIGDRAFYNLSELEDIILGSGLKSIGSEVFKPGFEPARVYIPDVKTWTELEFEDDGIPTLYLTNFIYHDWKIIDHLTVEEGVEHINPYAFYNNTTLITIHMPTTLKSIGDYAFYGCGKLDELHIDDLASWCAVSFAREYSNPLRYAKDLFLNDAYITDLTIPAEITTVSAGAFEGCDSLKSLKFEGEGTVIESYAFYECEGLESIDLSGVTEVGDWAFYGCIALADAKLETVEKIGNDAFRSCTSLATASLSSATTSVGEDIFASCPKLLTIVFDGSEDEWSSLEIELPEDVTINYKTNILD